LPQPLEATWAATQTETSGATGSPAKVRGLRVNMLPLAQDGRVEFRYALEATGVTAAAVIRITDGAPLAPAKVGEPYAVALEAADGRAVSWSLAGGKLPPGLRVDRRGLISGTPTQPGTFVVQMTGVSPDRGRPFNEPDVAVRDVRLDVK
jgi:hypothetical protein